MFVEAAGSVDGGGDHGEMVGGRREEGGVEFCKAE
jgi:hypothetical protein